MGSERAPSQPARTPAGPRRLNFRALPRPAADLAAPPARPPARASSCRHGRAECGQAWSLNGPPSARRASPPRRPPSARPTSRSSRPRRPSARAPPHSTEPRAPAAGQFGSSYCPTRAAPGPGRRGWEGPGRPRAPEVRPPRGPDWPGTNSTAPRVPGPGRPGQAGLRPAARAVRPPRRLDPRVGAHVAPADAPGRTRRGAPARENVSISGRRWLRKRRRGAPRTASLIRSSAPIGQSLVTGRDAGARPTHGALEAGLADLARRRGAPMHVCVGEKQQLGPGGLEQDPAGAEPVSASSRRGRHAAPPAPAARPGGGSGAAAGNRRP
jgi:hypothetical protein